MNGRRVTLVAALLWVGPAAAQGVVEQIRDALSGPGHPLADSPAERAREDMDLLRNAITLHDSQNRPLAGASLEPLVGRYLQSLPKDPWGNDYRLDASIGFVLSFGADGKAGGTGDDQDRYLRYRSWLKIQRATLKGSWGSPVKGTHLALRFNKPFVANGKPLDELVLILDPRQNTVLRFSGREPFLDPPDPARQVPMALANLRWGVTWGVSEAETRPAEGLLVLEATGDVAGVAPQSSVRLTPSMAVNLISTILPAGDAGAKSKSVLRERFVPGGPADASVHGSGAVAVDGAHPLESIDGENRGVPFERAR